MADYSFTSSVQAFGRPFKASRSSGTIMAPFSTRRTKPPSKFILRAKRKLADHKIHGDMVSVVERHVLPSPRKSRYYHTHLFLSLKERM